MPKTTSGYRILVICVSRIGDTLFSTPAIRAIATSHPDATITVLGHPKRAEVLRNLPFISAVGTINKQRAIWQGHLCSKRYDISFVFGFDEPLVKYALRVSEKVVAFRQNSETINQRLFRLVEPPQFQSEHAVLQLLRLTAALDIPHAGLRLAYSATLSELTEARRRVDALGLTTTRPLIGLQVASFATKAYRDWPIEYFAELCQNIVTQWPDCTFLLFGGKEEINRVTWLQQQLGRHARILAGRLTLRETAALMGLTNLYIGVDTGPTHLMSTYDIPMVVMYHCLSSSSHTGPLDHPCAYLINHPGTDNDCSDIRTMAEISVDRVWQTVQKALREHPPL